MVAGAARTRDDELDEGVLRRAQAGDQRAFRLLVERYQRPVYQLLWRMLEATAGAARAEELTQETFLRVFRALRRFDPSGPARLSTWIFTIATRLALNERRRLRPVTMSYEDRHSGGDAADASVHRAELRQAVRGALAGLDPPFRAVLVLREYHDLDYDEIASALGVGVGTVKSRLSRARAAVRSALQEVHDA